MQSRDWHPEDVKAAIRKTGITLDKLAVQNGYCSSAATKTLTQPWSKIQTILARHLGLTPQEIWPSRYDEAGVPIDKRRANGGRIKRLRVRTRRKNTVVA